MKSRSETVRVRDILDIAFADCGHNFNVHLWNGSILRFGPEQPEFRLLLMDKQVFKVLFRDLDPARTTKALENKEIEVHGDAEKARLLLQSLDAQQMPRLQQMRLKYKIKSL